jgi:hypothetical protein
MARKSNDQFVNDILDEMDETRILGEVHPDCDCIEDIAAKQSAFILGIPRMETVTE